MGKQQSDPGDKSPIDIAADLFLYAPVGILLEINKALPELIEKGRSRLDRPLGAAKVIGKLAVDQQRNQLAEKFRQSTAPYFGGGEPSSPQAATAEHAPRETVYSSSPEAGIASEPAPEVESLAIPGYTVLSASQVLEHLDGLSQTELDAVAAYESATRRRLSILARIDQLRTEQ